MGFCKILFREKLLRQAFLSHDFPPPETVFGKYKGLALSAAAIAGKDAPSASVSMTRSLSRSIQGHPLPFQSFGLAEASFLRSPAGQALILVGEKMDALSRIPFLSAQWIIRLVCLPCSGYYLLRALLSRVDGKVSGRVLAQA